jgi:hypothetical protein
MFGLITKTLSRATREFLGEGKRLDGWLPVTECLPDDLETVWVSNGKGWVGLGCRIETNEGWHWAESNGVIYAENGQIVSECESEDLDVQLWHKLPKVPTL